MVHPLVVSKVAHLEMFLKLVFAFLKAYCFYVRLLAFSEMLDTLKKKETFVLIENILQSP